MRKSLGHTGAVRISVLGNNNSPSNANAAAGAVPTEEEEFFPPTAQSGSTWNYHEYYHSVQKTNEATGEEDTEEEEEEYTPVIIRGDPLGCFSAVRQILPLVDHAHDPDIIFEVPILRSKHNVLIGKAGLVVAALSAEHEVRIMVPENDSMSASAASGGNVNYWHQHRPQFGAGDAGSAMLFSDSTNVRNETVIAPVVNSQPSTLPPNVIQLEGDIDNIERCLIKILTIVSGERYFPTGVIVHPGKENEQSAADEVNADTNSKSKDDNNTKAIAVLTAGHDAPRIPQNKIRSVQRKTNTLIRRKKGRFRLKGVDYGGVGTTLNSNDVEEETLNEDDDASTVGSKASVSFVISGKAENVKQAAAQFEKLLGLESNSSLITMKDGPAKCESPTAKNSAADNGVLADSDKKKKNQRPRTKKRLAKNETEAA